MSEVPNELLERLEAFGQEHLVDFWSELDDDQQVRLRGQLEAIDFELISELFSVPEEAVDWSEVARRAQPPSAIRLQDAQRLDRGADAIKAGEEILRRGEVAVVIVAGGQGTRLGFDRPKGCFPIGPVSQRTLFQMLFEIVGARRQRYDTNLPLLIMTSPATDAQTRDYLADQDYFGLAPETVHCFCQGTMPAVDRSTGKVLLQSKGSIALSPDGHGGMLSALAKSGLLERLQSEGVKYLYYCQIDNPLAQVAAPELLGFHALAQSELTTQVVGKVSPTERVGNVVEVDGRLQIIEYSDLDEKVAQQVDSQGGLLLWAGNIAIHVFDVAFLDRVKDQRDSLPFHIANKKVPYLNSEGISVSPEEPNGVKFERFIFDLLPHAKNALAVEAAKAEAFAPVKNADGAASDTPAAAKAAISDLARQWLEKSGVSVADGVLVEISPGFALDQKEVSSKSQGLGPITEDSYIE